MNGKDFRLFLFFIIGALILYAWGGSETGERHGAYPDGRVQIVQDLHYSDFLKRVDSGEVLSAIVSGDLVSGRMVNGGYYRTRVLRHDPMLVERLLQGEVDVRVEDMSPNPWTTFLITFVPWLVFIGVVLWMFNRGSRSGKGLFSVGRSKARLITPSQAKVTFKDVAGIDEAREDLVEIVDYLRNPRKFMDIGGKIPKGILLVGPPGTGKTLTAKAVAGEAGVPFYTVSGSDFVEMFVGVGASRVRDMFAQARKSAPCIVFIDEIDAVGRKRDGGAGGANDEREQTLNQLLVEMDGFEDFGGVIIIGATNRPDVLDPALLRPGRFDRQVVVSNPDLKGREQILRVHMSKVNLAPDVDPMVIARGTPGFSGAELANLVNEAALLAARRDRKSITMGEFEAAKDKILMGSERKSMIMSEEERKLTAYHEAGHALVGIHVEGNDPLHKVTIIPRGRALGVTMSLPERDRHGYTRKEILAKMAMMFGGRAAEELIFGKEYVTTGASNDIQQASNLARRMVREWGMSDAVGPLDYAEAGEGNFLGIPGLKSGSVSEETAREIDLEVKTLIKDAEKKAKSVLTTHEDQLHTLSEALLERETLSREDVEDLLGIRRSASQTAAPAAPAPEAGGTAIIV